MTSTIFFPNSGSLERPGLIIESLEYVFLLDTYLHEGQTEQHNEQAAEPKQQARPPTERSPPMMTLKYRGVTLMLNNFKKTLKIDTYYMGNRYVDENTLNRTQFTKLKHFDIFATVLLPIYFSIYWIVENIC